MRLTIRAVVSLIVLIVLCSACQSQHALNDIPRIYYPYPLAVWEWQKSAGLAVATLPKDIVEEEINQSPAIDFHSRLGLPLGLSVDGRLLTQILTNHFALGLKWSLAMGRFSFAVGDDVAWWFGVLAIEGFDNSANGWLNYPNLSFGYDCGDFLLSVRAEAVIVLSFSSYAGENRISSDKNVLGGVAFAVAMEQPFWKDTYVTLGFKASFLRFYYQSWFTYETFNRYLFIPEVFLGFLL